MITENGCPTFPHFGATYPDAVCIDGFLWDLDSCDDENNLLSGGEEPCPFCNFETFVENHIDEENDVHKETLVEYVEKLRERYGRHIVKE